MKVRKRYRVVDFPFTEHILYQSVFGYDSNPNFNATIILLLSLGTVG